MMSEMIYGVKKAKENCFHNLPAEELIQRTVKAGNGELTADGSLVVKTGKHTGRAASDKYVVSSPDTEKKVWWGKDVKKMTLQNFQKLKERVIQHFASEKELYVADCSVGASEKYNLGVRVLTPLPQHALFASYMFRASIAPFDENRGYTVYHAPQLKVAAEDFETRSETIIVTCFEERSVVIVGTLYAGEIKKSIFSIMNYLLPDRGVLPMHSGANIDEAGETSVFFGLSGTGKTTLSTDVGKRLIGDDEHGLCDGEIFNFEGGCYAKTYKLAAESEPEIFAACTQKGALLENVVVNKVTRQPDFMDMSLAENSRGTYPLRFIKSAVSTGKGPVPKNIFFLSADAFGVLPPVSKLNRAQAMYYFLSGYTAKLAGTEIGVKEPTAAFSTCFGAPFMLRHPEEYGKLLGHFLDRYPIQVWLINTGWTGGGYGVGERFPIRKTREIIRAIQAGKLDRVKTKMHDIFKLHIPETVPGVESEILFPENTWSDKALYEKEARKLASLFHKNIEKFGNVDEEIKAGGPSL